MLCGQAFQLLTVRFKGGFLFFVSVDFPVMEFSFVRLFCICFVVFNAL